MKQPCYNCPDRHIGCHAQCERYKAYTAEYQKQKRQQEGDREFRDYTRERCERMRKLQESRKYTAFMMRRQTV